MLNLSTMTKFCFYKYILDMQVKRGVCQMMSLTLLSLVACHYSTPEELKAKFYSSKNKLVSFTAKLESDKKFDSVFHVPPYTPLPDFKNAFPKEFALAKELGIVSITSCKGSCLRNSKWYFIETNWPSKHPVFLIYNFCSYNYYYDTTGIPCDCTESHKGFYKKDKYENETWGLGDNWTMFRFVDTIRDFKQ